MAMVMREVNDLGSTLQRQRTEAVESTALLTHVMEEIGVAVFAFDPANQLLLVNKAGEAAGRQAERRARRPAGLGARIRRVPRRRSAPPGRSRVRRPARPLRSAPRRVLPRRPAAPSRRPCRPQPGAARTGAGGLAAHRARAVARDQQLAHADQVDRPLAAAHRRSRAGVPADDGSAAGTLADRGAIGRARPISAVVRAARAAAEAEPAAASTCPSSSPGSSSSRSGCPWSCSRRRRCSSPPTRIRSSSCSSTSSATPSTPRSKPAGSVSVGWKRTGELVRAQHRRRGQRAAGHVEPVRAVLHDEAQRIGHRPGAQPADRRGPRRHDLAREPPRRFRLPRDAQTAAPALTLVGTRH